MARAVAVERGAAWSCGQADFPRAFANPWARRAGWRDLGSEPCGGAPNIGEGRSSLVTDSVCRVCSGMV